MPSLSRRAFAEALGTAFLLAAVVGQITLLNYSYFAALTLSAFYENASAEEQKDWRDRLTALQEQLREWAENNPPTFADKHALVSAEIARIEGRDTDAMRLYEQAIRSAREHGFVKNEGVSHEVAAGGRPAGVLPRCPRVPADGLHPDADHRLFHAHQRAAPQPRMPPGLCLTVP